MPTPVFTTGGTVLTEVRARTRVGAMPKSTALQDTAMYRKLHDVNEQYVNEPYAHGVLGWKFLARETIIQTVASSALNGAISAGDTTVVLSSFSSFDQPSSDVAGFFIKNANGVLDFCTYEARTGNTCTVVEGVQIDHANGEEVHKIYRLPSDYGKPRALFRSGDNVEYGYLDGEMRQAPPYGYYMVKTLYGTNYNGDFLVFPLSVGAVDWKFYYVKKPNTITTLNDKIDAPNGTGREWVIEKMCAHVWTILGEYDLVSACEERAEVLMQKHLAEWTTHTVQPNQYLSTNW